MVLVGSNGRHAPPAPWATFCATFIYAHLSTYYEYPPKKQTSSNLIKRENENLNPARLPIPPLARGGQFQVNFRVGQLDFFRGHLLTGYSASNHACSRTELRVRLGL